MVTPPDVLVASLYLAVRDERREPPQGNVFVSLTHEATNTTWRTLLWNRSTRSFLFPDLPLGAFSYRVWTSSADGITGRVTLDAPGAHHESATLPTPTPPPRLELPIRERLTRWRSRLASPAGPIGGPASPGALLADAAGRLSPICCRMVRLSLGDGAAGPFGIMPSWAFHRAARAQRPYPGDRHVARAILVITNRVAASPTIRQASPDATNVRFRRFLR